MGLGWAINQSFPDFRQSGEMTTVSTDIPSTELAACRQLLATMPAPSPQLVTIATLSASLNPSTAVALSYVPDQLVLTRVGFDTYVAARAEQAEATPEVLAAMVAADVANEVVPKWLRVTVNRQSGGVINHSVTVEDRQPGWDHLSLFKSP
jgi:7-cyano-7-deazaguanine reductase